MVRVATQQDELNFLTFHLSLAMHSESIGGDKKGTDLSIF